MSEKTLGQLAFEASIIANGDENCSDWNSNEMTSWRDGWESAASAIRNVVLEEADGRISAWMIAHGLITGHGDTIENLLGEIVAGTREAVLEEAAKKLDSHAFGLNHSTAQSIGEVHKHDFAADQMREMATEIRALKHAD